MRRIFQSGKADRWNQPRQTNQLGAGSISHGKIMPMEEPSLLERLLGRA